MKKVAIIGAGAVGHFFAKRFAEADYSISLVVSQSQGSAEKLADVFNAQAHTWESLSSLKDLSILVLAVPDDAIATVVDRIKDHWLPLSDSISNALVFHCSGLKSRSVLSALSTDNSSICAIHPLRSITAGQTIGLEEAITCGIEIPEAERPILDSILEDLNLDPVWLNEKNKAQYHLAASMISNFSVSIQAALEDLCEDMRTEGSNIELAHFGDLLRGTLKNVDEKGVKDALTGPIQRGDIGTVEAHLQILEENYPNLLSVYKQLAKLTLNLALERKSISDKVGKQLNALLG